MLNFANDVRVDFALCCIAAVLWTWTGLLALWAAEGRGPFLLRALVCAAPLPLLWSAGAKDLIPLYLAQWTLVFAVLLWRERPALSEGNKSPFRRINLTFTLRGVLMASAVAPLLWRAHTSVPGALLLVGAAALANLSSIYLVTGRHWLTARFVLWAISMLATWNILTHYLEGYSHYGHFSSTFGGLISGILTVGLLTLSRQSVFRPQSASTGAPPIPGAPGRFAAVGKVVRRAALAVLLLWMTVLPVTAFIALLSPAPVPAAFSSAPNGYHDLLQLCNDVVRLPDDIFEPNPFPYMTRYQFVYKGRYVPLETIVAESRAPLESAHDILQTPSFVVLSYTGRKGKDPQEIIKFQKLCSSFEDHTRFAIKEGRVSDAANSCIDEIKLAYTLRRDGAELAYQFGLATEIQALKVLNSLQPSLSSRTKRSVATALRDLEHEFPSFERMMPFQRAWTDRDGWRGPLDRKLDDWIGGRKSRRTLMLQEATQHNFTALQALIKKYETRP